MVVTLSIVASLLLIGCLTLSYQLWKIYHSLFSRARAYVDSLYRTHKKTKIELNKRSEDLLVKEKNLDKQYNKLKENLDKKREELDIEYKQKKLELDQEVEDAVKDAEEALKHNISRVDNMLEERLAEITAKNTKMFSCLCNDKPIACFIDLSEENTYRCPDCGTVYSVEITMNPSIIGKAISDEDYVALIKNRIEGDE